MTAPTETAMDWRTLPLEPGGRGLIEASAGTGKTWTIAALYLRLLLERGLSPRQVVVTTFTDAAAGELRERLRRQLLTAERLARAFVDGEPLADGAGEDARWLVERWSDPAAIGSDPLRLRLAIAELDLAPIDTLHGVCRRILADFPFESGSAFGTRALVSSDAMTAELARDVFRQLQDPAASPVPADATLGAVAKRLRAYLAPGVSMAIPPLPPPPVLDLPAAMAGRLRRVADRKVFTTSKRTLKKALGCLADYLESTPRDPALLPKQIAQLAPDPRSDHVTADGLADVEVQRVLDFSAEAARQLQAQADHAALVDEHRELLAWAHWVERARQWRAQRLAAQHQLTFDELIESVHAALTPGGSALADRLHAAFPVALVDEFQDTDAMQYAILDRIYREPGGAQRGRLVMIGDPKQAIYRFRGGDIHAYLSARDDAGSHLTLAANHRSSRELVEAVDGLYALAGRALGSAPDQPIRVEPVRPGVRADATPYAIAGVRCAQPLQLHYQPMIGEAAEERRDSALRACANHIVALLDGTHTLGDRPLAAGDIAVLLPTNRDIAQLAALLRWRRVPVVSAAQSSVFTSDWARELQLVLHAAHHARDDGARRAALATRLFGVDFDGLRALRDDNLAWQREIARFARLGRKWRTQGVLAVVRDVLDQAGPRLLAAGDGERALTDLRHLGELLQARSVDVAGPEELLGWLASERARDALDDGDAGQEMQLRIESDARRVRLLTLHASKGLEFPVVLLPLMWANCHRAGLVLLHDDATGARVPGLGPEAQTRWAQEGQDERHRLLYVALTRASHACHVYALPPERKGALADPERAPLDAIVERLRQPLAASPGVAHPHLGWREGWPWPDARLPLPAPVHTTRHVPAPPPVAPFEFKWSFSTLTKDAAGALEEAAANDEAAIGEDWLVDDAADPVVADEPPHPELLALATIAGAEFGNALHAIFEHRDLDQPMAAQHALVRRELLDSGVRLGELDIDALVPRVARRVQGALDAPLALGDGHEVRLGALPARQLRAEMAFDFVLDDVDLDRLRRACGDHGEPDLVPRTGAHHLRGLMTGRIDLVFAHAGRFHVLDYKGNRLGVDGAEARLSAYSPAALARAMDASQYRFQALLYVVAVDRYLRQRLGAGYDRTRQLGEVVYLFVRAAGLGPDAGVWAHRFPDALLDAVDRVLAGAPELAA